MITTIRTTGRELTDEYLGCDIKVFEGTPRPTDGESGDVFYGVLVIMNRKVGSGHSPRYGIRMVAYGATDVIGLDETVVVYTPVG